MDIIYISHFAAMLCVGGNLLYCYSEIPHQRTDTPSFQLIGLCMDFQLDTVNEWVATAGTSYQKAHTILQTLCNKSILHSKFTCKIIFFKKEIKKHSVYKSVCIKSVNKID